MMTRATLRTLLLPLAVGLLGACTVRPAATAEPAPPDARFDAAPRASGDTLLALVKAQVDLGPRNPGSKGHEACHALLLRTLQRYGVDSVSLYDLPVKTFQGTPLIARNILASINPQVANRILYVAHWDTRPWADNDEDIPSRLQPVPGANDGASGVSVLLEVARLVATDTTFAPLGIDLLFVDAEDCGESENWGASEETWCLGTQAWARKMPYTAHNKPRFGVLFDMVGGFDARFHREHTSHMMAPAVVDKVWAIAQASGMADRFPNTIGATIIDDHLFLNRAGIPTINIIENVNPETGSFNPTWHTLADDVASIDPRTLEEVAQIAVNVLYNELSIAK